MHRVNASQPQIDVPVKETTTTSSVNKLKQILTNNQQASKSAMNKDLQVPPNPEIPTSSHK